MSKQELIALMVKNYYQQVEIVGGQTSVTLEDYLRGIMFNTPNSEWTSEDLAYGLSLSQEK